MNYDGIETTAEILSAFQQCQDAGEEIDLFEALAWRDEPQKQIEAFVEIVQKIKLEPVLALATQALGWVDNTEELARLEKSDDLLSLLSNLAKSGTTDLIKWSAAKSIIAIGFDFIRVSQHLTEMPKDIIVKIRDNCIRRSSTETDSINFWVYGDTFSMMEGGIYIREGTEAWRAKKILADKVKEVLVEKGVRGIKEINFHLKDSLDKKISNSIDFTISSQQVSQEKLSKISNKQIDDNDFEILLLNQIYCVGSQHLEARKSAIIFLHRNGDLAAMLDESSLNHVIKKVKDTTDSILSIARREVEINKDYVDLDDTGEIKKSILDDFESTKNDISASQKSELKIENNKLSNKSDLTNSIDEKIKSICYQINEDEKKLLYLFLLSPLTFAAGCILSWIAIGFFGGLLFTILGIKVSDPLSVINVCSIFMSGALTSCAIIYNRIECTSNLEKKLECERELDKIKLEERKINKQIQEANDLSRLKSIQNDDRKQKRTSGIGKLERLLKERDRVYELIN